MTNLIPPREHDIKTKNKEDENGSRDMSKFWKRSLKLRAWESGAMVFSQKALIHPHLRSMSIHSCCIITFQHSHHLTNSCVIIIR